MIALPSFSSLFFTGDRIVFNNGKCHTQQEHVTVELPAFTRNYEILENFIQP